MPVRDHPPELWACDKCGAVYMDLARIRAVSDGNDPKTGEAIYRCTLSQQLSPYTDPEICLGTIYLRARLQHWIIERRRDTA